MGYLAPEQARGEDVDARTDVFALGIVFWEMVTSTRLFSHDSELATISEAIIMKALAMKPADRYDSALAMQRDIEAWLAKAGGDPPTGPGDVSRLIASKRTRRKKARRKRVASPTVQTPSAAIEPVAPVDERQRQRRVATALSTRSVFWGLAVTSSARTTFGAGPGRRDRHRRCRGASTG